MINFLDYKWEITPQITQLLIELQALKIVYDNLSISPQIEENLRNTALLKSAVYSARIEGYPDTISSPKLESQNLRTAYKYVNSPETPTKLTVTLVRELHKIALHSISGSAGQWRSEPWAVFNQAGIAIHYAAPYSELPQLMPTYTTFINDLVEHSGTKAAIAQFIFEKIHPFADGNGRVGRLISAHILSKFGYGFRGLTPFEEYIDKHRDDYYSTLEPSHKITPFIEFFLQAVISQSHSSLEKINNTPSDNLLDLPPRRQEIYQIIRDHPYSSFNFIYRRFQSLTSSTLHYDIAWLIKQGLIKKIGVSRGATYLAKSDIL